MVFCLCVQGISRIRIESEFTKGLLQRIKGQMFSEDVFDVVQARVGICNQTTPPLTQYLYFKSTGNKCLLL